MSRFENFFRCLAVVTQVVEVYVYGGLVFGFNTLVYILKKEGLYSHLCTETGYGNGTSGNETVVTCNAQEILFTEIATVGFVSFYIAIFSGGILLDKFGLWLIRHEIGTG